MPGPARRRRRRRSPTGSTLARICSRVENEWVGAQTGLLDQIASLFGEPESALRIDFRSLEVTPVALELDGYRLVTLDSGERHANAGGADDDDRRRLQPAPRRVPSAPRAARRREPARRDARARGGAARAAARPRPHVITENARVRGDRGRAVERGPRARRRAAQRLARQPPRLLCHLDPSRGDRPCRRCVDAGAIGARIVGGGFGGHVLGLMPPDAQPPPGALEVEPGPGARIVR